MERYETLIEEIPLEAFTGASDRESVATAGDAQIVCETLVVRHFVPLEPHGI